MKHPNNPLHTRDVVSDSYVSVSRRSRDVPMSRLDQNAQRLGLISVSDLCISDLVSVSTQNVLASCLGSRTISSCWDISCRHAQLNYNSPMKTSRLMPYCVGRILGTVCLLTFPLLIYHEELIVYLWHVLHYVILCVTKIFIYHTSRSRSRQLQRLGLVSDLCVSGLVSSRSERSRAHHCCIHHCIYIIKLTLTFKLSSVSSSSITRQVNGFVVEEALLDNVDPSSEFACRCFCDFLLNARGNNLDSADSISVLEAPYNAGLSGLSQLKQWVTVMCS